MARRHHSVVRVFRVEHRLVAQTDNAALKELTKTPTAPELQGTLPRSVLGSNGRFEVSRGLNAA